MATKTKKAVSVELRIKSAAANMGIILLSAATTLGMIDMPDHLRGQVIIPNQPLVNFSNLSNYENNQIRRERDETAPHYISYSVSQRTPARSGKK